jgi:hypothetical protein
MLRKYIRNFIALLYHVHFDGCTPSQHWTDRGIRLVGTLTLPWVTKNYKL